ncbi:RtcB family protein [Desulfovibrio mangrovi]|uniref:RtcB family protein n=1 Tax=Desulfovibrio mangrovi TaxID=2976983 RepID=UPI002246B831|nr:RtcB family protein [Desulfovibrio mangrovi]UZP68451.1 RtcB family protein [Desulfovibrio mangrovi]
MAKKKKRSQHHFAPPLFKDVSLIRQSEAEWHVLQQAPMRVPCHVFATDAIRSTLDLTTLRQACNVATLPGIVTASMVMPDAHSGYGFPIGGVAAFDPDAGGVVSAGGVGFDIACGVRTLVTGLTPDDVASKRTELAEALFHAIPCGVGTGGDIILNATSLDAMLEGGAKWAVAQGYGTQADLDHTEEGGHMRGARPEFVSAEARKRFTDQLGTLGSGNHYMEIQRVTDIYDPAAAQAYGIAVDDILLSIHCGSRGLGHQIGTDFLPRMADKTEYFGIDLPEKELACAPILSDLGQEYLGAMRAGINCALANRQVLTHLARDVFNTMFPHARLRLVYDVSHNTCKEEEHVVNGKKRRLFVHRKGATRAFGPGHQELPGFYRSVGQPVIVGGSMGTPSYILAGCESSTKSFCSANHGAGRSMSRTAARKIIHGKDMLSVLERMGISIRTSDMRGIAEEAPDAYKDVNAVVEATELAGLARRVVRAVPLICIKG